MAGNNDIKSNNSELVAVKRSSAGLGLFAKIDINKGAKIIEYIGEIIDQKESNRRGGRYLFQTSKNRIIDGSDRNNIARYANYSCRPNAETEVIRGRVYIHAKRKIRAGDEITYDYGQEYFDEYIALNGCKCVKCLSDKPQLE